MTDPDLDNVRGWVDDGFDPLMFRGDVMASVCGREIARPSKQGHASAQTVIEAVLRLIPCFPGEPADRFTALVKQWIAEDGYRDFLAVTDLASLVAAQAVIASAVPARGPLVAHKQHPLMDKAAHHRPAFGLGISAYSTRIYNYESIRHENLRGWHLSDGMVLLYTDDLGHYSEDYWPTVDPTRLPGTTVIAGRPADAAGQRTTSTADWAGGTALPDTTLGAYGMELRAFGSTLHGLKSWSCLDDVIACVGSGITAEAGTAETVVENRKLRDPRAALLVNGSTAPDGPGWSDELADVRWLHLAGTGGYVFPRPASVRALREERTATWREINLTYGTDIPVTRPYLTLWHDHDHGPAPSGAGYFHLQLPAASAGRTRQLSAAPPVELVADSTAVHAVRRGTDGLRAANFWRAGGLGAGAELRRSGVRPGAPEGAERGRRPVRPHPPAVHRGGRAGRARADARLGRPPGERGAHAGRHPDHRRHVGAARRDPRPHPEEELEPCCSTWTWSGCGSTAPSRRNRPTSTPSGRRPSRRRPGTTSTPASCRTRRDWRPSTYSM